jgi:hypothetical protein
MLCIFTILEFNVNNISFTFASKRDEVDVKLVRGTYYVCRPHCVRGMFKQVEVGWTYSFSAGNRKHLVGNSLGKQGDGTTGKIVPVSN